MMSVGLTKENDNPFAQATEILASGKAYLGNPEVVKALVLQIMQADHTHEMMQDTAKILLGQNDSYVPIAGFHKPGAIDQFFASVYGYAETEPFDLVCHGVLELMKEARSIVELINLPGSTKDVWETQAECTLEWFTDLFMGVDPRNEDERFDRNPNRTAPVTPLQEQVLDVGDLAEELAAVKDGLIEASTNGKQLICNFGDWATSEQVDAAKAIAANFRLEYVHENEASDIETKYRAKLIDIPKGKGTRTQEHLSQDWEDYP